MMLLLMAFWQEDVGFLTDVSLMLSGAIDRSDLDVEAFQEEIGVLMGKYRGASLKDIQLGPVLQEMTEISLRHGVPLPASLDADREGDGADAAGSGTAGSRGRPFRRGGPLPDAERPQGDGGQDRPQGALLPGATTQGSRSCGSWRRSNG